jgi:hypothetical protein
MNKILFKYVNYLKIILTILCVCFSGSATMSVLCY